MGRVHRRVRATVAIVAALTVGLPSQFAMVLAATFSAMAITLSGATAVSVTAVTPYGASAGISVQITGAGFDPAAANNSVTLTPTTGAAVTLTAETIATLDASKGLRRLGIKVPAGFPIGPASVRVTNLITGQSAYGSTLQVIAISLPETRSAARGAQNVVVPIVGTPNVQFAAGRTTIVFGAGVTVTSTQVTSATSLLATVSISATTPLGLRNVIVVTSTQTAQLPGAFTITGATPVQTPIANAGPDQTVAVGTTVTLNGGASSHPNGHPLTFQWTLTSKPQDSEAVLSDPAAVMPTFVADRRGTYDVQLIVYDGATASAPDTVRISTENSRPVASAGADRTASVGDTVRLNGIGSSDPDGDPLTFAWSFVSVPPSSGATLANATSVEPSFVVDKFGDYTIQLVVSDGILQSLADTVTISTLNSVPVANAGPDQTARVSESVALDGSGSNDADGHALSFRWSFTSKPPGSLAALSDPATVNPNFSIDVAGTFVVQLIVNDGLTDSLADTVSVTTVNSPPVANAGPDQTVFAGNTVQLTGAGSTDVDGHALTFAWSLTTKPAGSAAALSDPAAVNPTFTADVAGEYIAQLIVHDGTVNSAADTVSINTQNQPPVANAGVNQTVLPGATVELDGTGSTDPNGDELTYQWSLVSKPEGSAAALSDATASKPTFVADTPGSYVAQLVVHDGTVSSAPHSVTISTIDSAPIANAGPDQNVVTGSTVQLDGSGSFDPDGSPLQFAWSILSKPADSAAALSNASIVNPTFVADRPGVYVAQLIVGDGTLVTTPDTVTITATDGADLLVAFHPPSTSTNPPVGSRGGVLVIVRNFGPAAATEVTASVPLPAGYTFLDSSTFSGAYDPATGTWTIGSLVPGQEAHLAIGATVHSTGPYDVTAAITGSSRPDPDLTNNTATAIVTPNPNADLRVEFHMPSTSTAPPVGSIGGPFVIVTNVGPATTNAVTASLPIPAGYTFAFFGAGLTGTYDPSTGIWNIGALKPGQQAHLPLALTVLPTGLYDFTATITSSSQPDPDSTNNTATVLVTPNPNADLLVELINPPAGTLAYGANTSLFVQVTNRGPARTTGVLVQFPVPTGYTITAGGANEGTYDPVTGIWSIGTMIAGLRVSMTLSLRVNPTGPIGLTATIAHSDQPDPDLANNTATPPPINRPPAADAGADQAVATNVPVALDGRGSSDPDGDAFAFEWSLAIRPGPSTATLSDANTATLSFVPDQGGRYVVQLVLRDSHGVPSAADTVTIMAAVLNQAPTIISAPVTGAAAGHLYRYDATAFDPDAGDTLTFSLPAAPAGMTIDPASGAIQWTPSDAQAGPQAVTLRVQDAAGLFDIQSFAVQVSSGANGSPIAADDAAEVRVGESISVGAPGVLRNDTDPNGSPLTVALAKPPANGSVTLSSDGSFIYTPHALRADDFVLAENVNLAARVPGTVAEAGFSFNANSSPSMAIDDDLGTSWRSNISLGPSLDVVFPQDVTVSGLQIVGHRDAFLIANEEGSRVGSFQLFGADGTELLNTGGVDLPLPLRDTKVNVANVAGVRRVRFTTTDGTPGFAELKVIGSALIRRPLALERNLAQFLPTVAEASSILGPNVAGSATDDLPASNWYAASTAAGQFIELLFPVGVTVTELQTVKPSISPDGFGTSLGLECPGNFELFDSNGAELFDSGVVNNLSGPLTSQTFTQAVPNVGGVRRVRWTSAGCAVDPSRSPFPPGFAEFRVFGSASVTTPALSVARKFQSLVGREVHSTPLVVNLTDDNHDGRIDAKDIPDIVVPVEHPTNQLLGEIKAISGDDGRELFTAGGPNLVSPWSELAAGDLDGDGVPEIVAVHADGSHLVAFDRTGGVRWNSDAIAMPRFNTQDGVGNPVVFVTGAVSIANLDGRTRPHIVVGASVFDADGHLLGDGRTLGGTIGGAGMRSAISTIADLDLDGVPEIVAGPTAYRLVNDQLTIVWQRTDRADGYGAIANLDDDPFAEVVIVANGTVYALNHDGTDLEGWNASVSIPGGGQGGAPLIVDADGDGRPEIGVAGFTNYVVFNRDGSVRWQSATSDRSSNSTGSVAFDLDGDGSVEIIYRDEVFLRIYRGADGVLLAKIPIESSTWSESPVVADVDNDGHADIVVTSDRIHTNNIGSSGVHVLQDIANKWTRTRPIWNQHSYHVTNVDDDGTIPRVERPHWLVPGLNSFRINAFIPGASTDERDSFTYKASDGTLESNEATVRIAVRPENSAPSITSTPITIAATSVRYSYVAQAFDPDAGEVFAFSLPTAPAGMTIDRDFGFVTWTPTDTQLGAHPVVIRVQDAHGAFALQHYTVNVLSPLTVPDVVGDAQASAQTEIIDAGFVVGGVATQTHPVVAAGSVISQSPAGGAPAVPGSAVSLVVSLGRAVGDADNDADGFSPNQGDCDDTTFNIRPGATDAPGNGVDEDCTGADAIDPRTVDGDGDGFTPAAGDCNDTNAAINPGAVDAPGNGIDENCNGADAIAGDGDLPTAAISSPADGALVTMPVDITGTATDGNLLRYQLLLSEADSATSTVIGSGSTPSVNGVLGRLDPTRLENGLYRVRLVGEDVNGQVAVDERVYRIDGQAKVGNARLSFIDLAVPVAGTPITIVRTYDSRVKTKEDFGIGWTLDIKRGSYRHNRTPGEGWRILPGSLGLPCLVVSEATPHLTEVRLSDLESYTFALTLSNTAGVGGGCTATAGFRFLAGRTPGATLEILDGNDVFYLNGDSKVVNQDTFTTYNPQTVRLKTADGRTFDLDRTVGIVRIQDLNGNALSIAAGGITHSSGKSVAFIRDGHGRITRITDPMGNTLNYTYDGGGNLQTVVDLTDARTTFTYDSRSNLLEVVDPLGRRAARHEYDGDGRLVGVVDANGQRMTVVHETNARRELITDRIGGVTVVDYDERGNVVRLQDPLGHVTLMTYDERDNKLSETDASGAVKTFTYDENNNRLSETDPLGRTTTSTYNARNQLLTRADARGAITAHVFDSRGNIVRQVDPLGGVTTHAYDARGNRISKTDAVGNTWRYVYDASGNQIESVDPLGNSTLRTFDPNGRIIAETTSRSADGGVDLATRRYGYDSSGRQTRVADPEGGVTRMSYTPVGQLETRIDVLGRETTYSYDDQDRVVRVTHPDGATELVAYDRASRVVSFIDRAGRNAAFSYDAANRQTATTFPDGTSVRTAYDSVGRVASETDERGGVVTYSYDAAGQNTSIRDPLNGTISFAYDRAGNPASRTDRNGHTTAWTYDLAGQLILTTLPGGLSTAMSYDAAGRRLSATDEAGQTTAFQYDGLNRLVRVTDAHGGQTQYAYDGLGYRTSITDPLGSVTRFAHDRLGRQVSKTLPMGEIEARAYDPAGNLTSLRTFKGETIGFTYDALNRLRRRNLPNGEVHEFAYTPTGKVAGASDPRGAITFTYDQRDRPLAVRHQDGTEIRYGYDPGGNRTSLATPGGTIHYQYDIASRLTSVMDPAGRVTSLGYDANGSLTRIDYANGVVGNYAYNELSRLVSLTQAKEGTVLRSYAYTLGPLGNRTSVAENDGVVRHYAYDALLRLTQETVTPSGGAGAPATIAYRYDAAGNRLTKTDNGGIVSYSYDGNSRLLAAGGGAFTYDGNGNLVAQISGSASRFYEYDALNRLTQTSTAAGGLTTYAYDALDNRVTRVDGSRATSFLVDPFGHNGTTLALETGQCCDDFASPLRLPRGARPPHAGVGLPQVLRERDHAGVATDYVYANTVLVSQQRAGAVSFYLPDGHMSVRALTDAAGAVTDRYDYDAFGNLIARAGTTENVYLFNSQQFDSGLGFYYLRARYYDPLTGRFASRDPSHGNEFDPPSLHPYTYAHNNPVNMHDPTGRMTMLELGIVSGVVGIIAGIAWYNYSGNAAEAAFVGVTAASIVFTGGWAVGVYAGIFALVGGGSSAAVGTAVAAAPVVAAGAQRALPYTQRLEWYTLRNQEVLETMLRATYRFYARMPSFLRIIDIVDDWANNPRQGMVFVCGMRYFLLDANQDTLRRALGPYADAAFADRMFFTLLRHAIGRTVGRGCPP